MHWFFKQIGKILRLKVVTVENIALLWATLYTNLQNVTTTAEQQIAAEEYTR